MGEEEQENRDRESIEDQSLVLSLCVGSKEVIRGELYL